MEDATTVPVLSCATIGVLTALEEEYAACLDVFDPDRQGAEHHASGTLGAFTCWLCQVAPRRGGGSHVIAITLLPDMGNNAAAIAATALLQHCPDTRYLIMCGIAGAVPHPERSEDHVRLGDIVVSSQQGVIQYDRGKQRDPQQHSPMESGATRDPLAGFEFRNSPRAPSRDLLDAVRRMHADEHSLGPDEHRDWEEKIRDFLKCCKDAAKWKRPHYNKDRLVDSPDGKGQSVKHPPDRARRQRVDGLRYPRVFHGPIATANIVQGDPARRNALRDRFSVKAIEMEGSGVADASWAAGVGYLVVRGTCDYCNTAKSDIWHAYAALIAACYTKTVIEYLHPSRSPAAEKPTHLQRPNLEHLETEATRARRVDPPSTIALMGATQTVGSIDTDTTATPPTQSSSTNTVAIRRDQVVTLHDEIALATPALIHAAIKDALGDLVSTVGNLLQEFKWEDARGLADDLENRLRMLPRKGNVVRQGWIALARIESQRLREAKQRGRKVDVSRLRALREEAGHVIE